MRKNKPISLVFISLLILSTLMIVYTPTVRSGNFTESGHQYFYGTLTPQVVSEGYEGKSVKFQFSLTSNTTVAHNITEVVVTAPTGWTITAAECNTNTAWTASIASPPASVTFTNNTASAMLSNGTLLLFNITANVKVGTGTWDITCSEAETSTSLGSVTESVLVMPYFKAEISPSVVKSGDTYTFNLKVTHNTTLSSIYMVNITYPTTGGWSYKDLVAMPDYWVIDSHDTANGIIVLEGTGGHFIAPGQSATFSFNMTLGSSAFTRTWSVTCINTAVQNATATLTVDVDDTAPIVSISSPSAAARVSGTVWINATITEAHLKEWVIKINGTQITTGATANINYLWNTLTCTDGLYIINITATDVVSNIGNGSVIVTVDNTAPQLLQIKVYAGTGEYAPIGNTIWIPNATSIQVKAAFNDTCKADQLSGYMYFNVTPVSFSNDTLLPTPPYDISGVTSLPVTINITDDQGNRYVNTWYVKKDFNPPKAPTYARYQLICGGIVIWGINATDAESLVVGYNVYINESTAKYITTDQLASTEWHPIPGTNLYSFSGVLVLDLTGAQWANITIAAVDGAENENATTVYAGEIPKGTWYPVVLYPKWNLVSLPLIPNSTSTANIYSLILKHGSAAVQVSYGFDNQAKTWIMNPPEITDGNGYWLYITDYDVLIVQGTPHEEYWGRQPVYYVLYKSWNLAGYTETIDRGADWYVSSLQEGTYFRYLFVWDAQNQRWKMVDTNVTSPGTLSPGQGFWILLYEDQTLVPPVP